MPDSPRRETNLLDLLAFYIRWRKFFLISLLIVCGSVAVISFVVKPKYRSSGLIKPADQSNNSIGSLISSKLAGLGGISGFAPGLGEVGGELLVVIMKSRSVSEAVINEFNLRSVYDMPDQKIEDVIEVLLAQTNFELDPATTTVTVEVEDTDPQRAKAMADFYIRQLDLKNQEVSAKRASKERIFTEQRLKESRSELTALEDSLTRFQLRTGVLNIEEQVKATVQAAAAIEAQRLIAKSEFELNSQIFEPGNPELEMSRMKLEGIETSMQTLISKRNDSDDLNFLVTLLDSPEEGMIYLRFERDIEIQSLLIAYLMQQYEQARVDEVRNTPTISIYESPVVGTKRVWPRRGLMVGLAALGTIMIGTVIGLFIEMIRTAADPNHPQHEKFAQLRKSLAK